VDTNADPGAAGTGDPDLTADRVDLRYLVEGYAIACDTRDPDALGACFADGAVLTVHWPDRAATRLAFPESAAAITTNLSRYDRTLHLVGNHRATIDGDTATGLTYCVAHHITGDQNSIMTIRYLDTYRRDPSGWRFVTRDLQVDWTEDTTVVPGSPGSPGSPGA